MILAVRVMNLRELLQDIQDVYAEKLQLTVILTDDLGRKVTSFSYLNSVTEYTLSSIRKTDKESKIVQRLTNLQHLVLIDTQHISPLMGMKIIVFPIQMENGHNYYIWAGNLIENGYKTFVLQGLQQYGESGWEKAAHDLKELSIMEIDEKVQTVKNMSIVMEKLIAEQQRKENLASIMNVSTNSIEGNYSSLERYQQYIKAIIDLDEDVDFIVFAKKHGSNHYKVVSADGKLKKLSSLTFSIEQTFVEKCIEKKSLNRGIILIRWIISLFVIYQFLQNRYFASPSSLKNRLWVLYLAEVKRKIPHSQIYYDMEIY